MRLARAILQTLIFINFVWSQGVALGGTATTGNTGVGVVCMPGSICIQSGGGSSTSATCDIAEGQCAPIPNVTTVDDCSDSAVLAQQVCVSPLDSTLSSDTAIKATAGTGMTTSDLMNMLGSGAGTMMASSSNGDMLQMCKDQATVAGTLRDLQGAYALACTAAMYNCKSSCQDSLNVADNWQKWATGMVGKPQTGPPGCSASNYKCEASQYAALKTKVGNNLRLCNSFVGNILKSAAQTAQYEGTLIQANQCVKTAETQCQVATAVTNPVCIQSCTSVPGFATAHSYCAAFTTLNCSLQQNAGSATCVCQMNPSDPMCSGARIAAATTNANAKSSNGLDPLSDTQGLGIQPKDPTNQMGPADGGKNVGGGMPPTSALAGGGGGGNGKGAAAGADPNIDRGFRAAGGYSVSGVPLAAGGGGGGGGNGGPNADQFNLAKYLPKGQGANAFRSMASLKSNGVDGITCANCMDIWTKVANQYNVQRLKLRP